jgi:hypothetical protein
LLLFSFLFSYIFYSSVRHSLYYFSMFRPQWSLKVFRRVFFPSCSGQVFRMDKATEFLAPAVLSRPLTQAPAVALISY